MSARRMLTTLIVFVVGLVVGPFLTPSPNNQPATTVSERANLAKATAFYVAANHFLNDGDDAPLLEMLAATFVDHSPLDTEPTATGLVRYLASLRATYPDMRLEANAIVARDDMVTIALATTEATTAIVDGQVPDRTSSIPGIERLRMQNGRVVERWASESLPSQYEQVASLEVLQPAGWFVFCVMERLEFEPGASMARRDSSDSLLIVDAGALSIEVDGGGEGEPRLLLPHGQIGDSVLQRDVPAELETESVALL